MLSCWVWCTWSPPSSFLLPSSFSLCLAVHLQSADPSPGSVTCHFSAILQTSLNKFRSCFLLFNGLSQSCFCHLKVKSSSTSALGEGGLQPLCPWMCSVSELAWSDFKMYFLSAELIQETATFAGSLITKKSKALSNEIDLFLLETQKKPTRSISLQSFAGASCVIQQT